MGDRNGADGTAVSGAITSTAPELSSSLGIAVLGSIFTTTYQASPGSRHDRAGCVRRRQDRRGGKRQHCDPLRRAWQACTGQRIRKRSAGRRWRDELMSPLVPHTQHRAHIPQRQACLVQLLRRGRSCRAASATKRAHGVARSAATGTAVPRPRPAAPTTPPRRAGSGRQRRRLPGQPASSPCPRPAGRPRPRPPWPAHQWPRRHCRTAFEFTSATGAGVAGEATKAARRARAAVPARAGTTSSAAAPPIPTSHGRRWRL